MSDLLPERVEVTALDHLYLTVADVSRSESFYDTVFGLLDFRKLDAAIAGDPHRHYFNRVMQVSIRQATTAGAMHDAYAPGLHHVCLQVADAAAVDKFHALATAKGIVATAPALYPQYADDYYATFFADPDGLRFEIVARRVRRKLTALRWAELAQSVGLYQDVSVTSGSAAECHNGFLSSFQSPSSRSRARSSASCRSTAAIWAFRASMPGVRSAGNFTAATARL
jgi:catechol 2,3-dioxygenase-like lactoylglutathione lyase family enzyme